MSADRYEFRIKKEVQKSGKEIYTPEARLKKRFIGFVSDYWERISCMYGKYMLMPLPFSPDLTEGECKEHIDEFKKTLTEETENDIQSVDYIEIDEEPQKEQI